MREKLEREGFRPIVREKQRRTKYRETYQRESTFRPIVREKQRLHRETEREGFRPIVREKQRLKHREKQRERVLDR